MPRAVPLPTLLFGLACLVAGAAGDRWLVGGALGETWREVLVERRLADCAAHDDGPADYNRAKLTQELERLRRSVKRALLALGAAALSVGAARCSAAGRRHLARVPLAVPLLAASFVAFAEARDQLALARDGFHDGLFTEDEAARRDRFFDVAVPAARAIAERVPAEAGVLFTDYDTPMTVYKASYLLFPRRMYRLPQHEARIDVATFRALAAANPAALARARKRGITHAVDLKRLVEAGDPDSIVALEEIE